MAIGQINIVSETIQEFMGVRYYLCGNYYQHKGTRLHRAVWEAHNGAISTDYHVHHIDGDRSNNQIENLALMQGMDHVRMHAVEDERRENGKKAILFAIKAAPEWHASDEGRKWHSQHAKECWKDAPVQKYSCTMCGREFETRCTRRSGNHFCGGNCRARYGRRKRAGVLA